MKIKSPQSGTLHVNQDLRWRFGENAHGREKRSRKL